MDQATLVREQVDGAEKLLRRLMDRGFEVRGACWAKSSEEGRWRLYIITPVVEQSGLLECYRRMGDALGDLDSLWSHPFERIDSFALYPVAPSDPLAAHVLGLYTRFPNLLPRFLGGGVLGHEYFESLYVYPSTLFQPQPQPAGG